MKTLQKLKLHNVKGICAEEQRAMKGGGCWYWTRDTGEWIYTDDNKWLYSYVSDPVIVLGGSGGVVANAESYIGVSECADPMENEYIIKWLQSTTNPNSNSDETPWCSAFVNGMMIQSGFEGTNDAGAKSWYGWGTSTTNPNAGDVAVRGDGHHVGIVVCVEGDRFLMIQGNYENAVAETWEKMSDYSFRTH